MGNFTITQELGLKNLNINGINHFWRNVAFPNESVVINFQDSSVILMDRSQFPKTLNVLRKILSTFNLGYGDKEIYWIAATIAQENFGFEPFRCSSYGNCGLLMHLDPNDSIDPEHAYPMYLNGEWLLEKIHVLGADIEIDRAPGYLENTSIPLFDLAASHWCTCQHRCIEMPYEVNQLMLRAQWERLQRGMSRKGPEYDCMPMTKFHAPQISQMIDTYYKPHKLCTKFGCPHTPIHVNQSYVNISGVFCNPISYTHIEPINLYELTEKKQVPPTPKKYSDGSLLQGSSKSVYLMMNGTLHEFPDGNTFLKMGFEWGHIQKNVNLSLYPLGEPLKPMNRRK